MSEGNGDRDRLQHLLGLERLSDTLSDRPAGDLFRADLEEARLLAAQDPRFARLADGLQNDTLGERMAAITRFFDSFTATELASLTLPPNLNQLRSIYLSSHPDYR